MTLLFYLKSSNGSVAPGPFEWDRDEDGADRRKRHKKKKFKDLHFEKLRKQEEELLLFLLDKFEI